MCLDEGHVLVIQTLKSGQCAFFKNISISTSTHVQVEVRTPQ